MTILAMFKFFRIGFVLFLGAFHSIFFEHQRYFIFCCLFTLLQFSEFMLIGVINPKLIYSTLIAESLAGLNLFDIVFNYVPFSMSPEKIGKLCLDVLILIADLYLMYIVSCAVAYYTWLRHETNATTKSAFHHALLKRQTLLHFTIAETSVLLIAALMGAWGNLAYFGWQLVTIFAIQIITFQDVGITAVVQKSFNYCTSNIKNILGIDTLVNFFLIILAVAVYSLYRNAMVEPIRALENYSYGVVLAILYIVSVLYVVQIIAFTNFYEIITKKKTLSSFE